MPRLQNRGFTARAPQTGAAWPELPDLSPQLSELDGGRTNAALQRWSDLVRQRVSGNEQQDNGRFRNIQTSISNSNGYLESVWTMQAIAGDVVTGMTLFSASDPENNRTVSRISFQADVFQINTSSGNKQVFSATATEIRLGDVLTVDLANAKLYIGDGDFGDVNTPFYVDELAFFSLGEKLTFDGDLLTVGNAYIDSDGAIVLGELDDVLLLSAIDPVYRIWAGNATAGSASFSVTKEGALFSNSGTIGGFEIGATSLVIGSGTSRVAIGQFPLAFVMVGEANDFGTKMDFAGFTVRNDDGSVGAELGVSGGGFLSINDTTGAPVATVSVVGFGGVGSALTDLNASNLSSGTVGTARLGSGSANAGTWLRGDQTWAAIAAGNVSGLAASATTDTTNAGNITSGTLPNARLSFFKNANIDVPIDGYVNVGGVKLATIA